MSIEACEIALESFAFRSSFAVPQFAFALRLPCRSLRARGVYSVRLYYVIMYVGFPLSAR